MLVEAVEVLIMALQLVLVDQAAEVMVEHFH
jgi:hypothetical protein